MLSNPARALRDGIWMIPAVIIGRQRWYHAPSLADLEAALRDDG